MITFVSLFLGLVLGNVDVALVAAPEVATIELLLDGRPVADLHRPWKTTIDMGKELAPHELVAVGRDANGAETGRVRQRINRPRPLAEAQLLVEPGTSGKGRVARLVWRCLQRENPISVVVTLDGKVVPSPAPARIELPNLSLEKAHLLRADLDFGGDVRANAEIVFGGARLTESSSSITAVPVLLENGQPAPSPASLEGKLVARGEASRVAAVEKGPAEVVFVLAGRATSQMFQMSGTDKEGAPDPGLGGRMSPSRRVETWGSRLDAGDRIRFLWTVPEQRASSQGGAVIFPATEAMSESSGDVLVVGGSLQQPGVLAGEWIADAVGVAALMAAEHDRRRAVVLLVGPDAAETSTLSAAEVRRFLERLRVPLFVWSLVPEPTPVAVRFGGAVDASRPSRFRREFSALARALDRQRIVWVEGNHLPQEFELVGQTPGLVLAR